MVQSVAFVVLFLSLGLAVAFVAFSGGPSKAREAYLTSGRRFFRIVMPVLYLTLGIAVPAVVIANGEQGEGGTPALAGKSVSGDLAHGKTIFRRPARAATASRPSTPEASPAPTSTGSAR